VTLPALLWTHLERLAEERGVTHSQLMSEALMRLVETDVGYVNARRRAMERLRNASSLTLDGKITWTRDELHER
jgi:predicted DNA-binding ribbon-helix-helix protein